MKKISVGLILIAAAMAVNAQQPMPERQNTTAMLDGKAFVITLQDNAAVTDKIGDDKSNMSTGQNSGMQKNDLKAGKKMLLRFDNGMVRTTGKNKLSVDNCAYQSTGEAASGISFSADCSGGMQGMRNESGVNSEENVVNNSSTPTSKDNTKKTISNAEGTTQQPQTGTFGSGKTSAKDATTSTTAGTTTSTSGSTTTVSNDAYDNGTVSVSGKSSKDMKMIRINGTVTGNSISGTLSCTRDDNSMKTYTFTGNIADKNDLDMEQEMGMK